MTTSSFHEESLTRTSVWNGRTEKFKLKGKRVLYVFHAREVNSRSRNIVYSDFFFFFFSSKARKDAFWGKVLKLSNQTVFSSQGMRQTEGQAQRTNGFKLYEVRPFY